MVYKVAGVNGIYIIIIYKWFAVFADTPKSCLVCTIETLSHKLPILKIQELNLIST